MSFNKIQSELFTQKQVVFVEEFFTSGNTTSLGRNKAEAFTLLLKCEQLGYSFNDELLNVISHGSLDEMKNFWAWFEGQAKAVYKGSKYHPMYPNFPSQVIEASDLELLINAFVHYSGDLFGLRILPDYEKDAREKMTEKVTPLRLSVMTKDGLADFFKNLLTSNASMSSSSKDVLALVFDYFEVQDAKSLTALLSSVDIPQKENLAFVGAKVLKSGLDFNKCLVDKFKTPTDLLRLSAALNDGDTSLAVDTKIKNMSRPMRRAFVAKLEMMLSEGDVPQFMENLFTYREQWVKLAHAMHVGEYKDKCPLVFEALSKVRKNERDLSFNYKVESLVESNASIDAAKMLAVRPGVFGRQLNNVLVKCKAVKDQEKVVEMFLKSAESIATPVLLQIHAKFKYDNQGTKKIVLPKGGLGKVFVKDGIKTSKAKALGVGEISNDIAKKIVDGIESTLIARFKSGPSLGNVYIEDSLTLQNVPFAQRTASKALKTVPKGSRFVKESTKPILRFFTWWNENGVDKEGKGLHVGRVDIDLSVGVFDENYNLIKQCTYYEMRTGDYLTHSGDITSAPNGAAEYIDLDIEKLKKAYPSAAYVGQLISSFTRQKYSELPECYSGWMERDSMQSGEIFEPSTVKNKVDVTSDSTQVLVCLYDVNRKEYIWADTPMVSSRSNSNNLNNVKSALACTIQGIAEMKKPNLYDLFEMHAKARGNIVNDKRMADTVFSLNEGVTPYDSEVIASKFMADTFVQEITKKPKMK